MSNDAQRQPDSQDIMGIDRYVTIAQTAQILQVSEDYIRKLIKNKELQSIKLPGGSKSPVRIPVEALKKIIAEQPSEKSRPHRSGSKRNTRRVYRGVFSE
jgi:excisionase family DNA binding protein